MALLWVFVVASFCGHNFELSTLLRASANLQTATPSSPPPTPPREQKKEEILRKRYYTPLYSDFNGIINFTSIFNGEADTQSNVNCCVACAAHTYICMYM